VRLDLRLNGPVVDSVTSYFGLREVAVKPDAAGVPRIFLNGEPLVQIGLLDQGFWPDGLYTAPSDEALRSDIELAKYLGMNLIRKHVKVEPDVGTRGAIDWGCSCGRTYPAAMIIARRTRRSCAASWTRLVSQKRNHPCIIDWVVFNEGWGSSRPTPVTATRRRSRKARHASSHACARSTRRAW
jgi:beta-galactosidase/beta-glucuronidase